MRDDFTQKTKDILAKRVAYRCSIPFCRCNTIGPASEPNKIISIGEAAHICAASEGGKRYDSSMTPEERSSINNGIWCCRNHAAMIDRDEKHFTVDLLKSWKEKAEKFSKESLSNSKDPYEDYGIAKSYLMIFRNDILKYKRNLDYMSKNPGIFVQENDFPIVFDWEKAWKTISPLIDDKTATVIYEVIRLVIDYKRETKKYSEYCNGRVMLDPVSMRYRQFLDGFIEKMNNIIDDSFLSMLAFYCHGA